MLASGQSNRLGCPDMKRRIFLPLALLASLATSVASASPEIDALLAVAPEGKGNAGATAAWKTLSASEPSEIIAILEATEGANPLAANWLRSAAEVIVARTLSSGGALPVAELGEFLLDTGGNPHARRMAFELIQKADATLADTLVPGLLGDPSNELRREAVQKLIGKGKALLEGDTKAAGAVVLRQALGAARDVDQVNVIAEALREQGGMVDLPMHFGFVMDWKVIGPFDNTGGAGFDTVFPPEKEITLDAEYEGKGGAKARWIDYVTRDEFGMVDINKPLSPLKEVTAYAYTVFEAAEARPVELRLGCKNAWKVWLNGELLFGRDEYHRGMKIDQYLMPAQLKAGENTLLVKLCQNEQTESWTVEWQFQLRVCDATGTAILAVNRPEPAEAEANEAPARRRRRAADPS
jgi:hypothetical protein